MVAIAATSSIYRPVLAPNLMWGSLISLVLPGVGALGRGRPGGIQPDVVPTSLLGEPRHQDGMNSKRVQAIMNKFFHSTPLNVWSLGNDTLTWRSFGYIFRVLTISASKILDITDRKENLAVHIFIESDQWTRYPDDWLNISVKIWQPTTGTRGAQATPETGWCFGHCGKAIQLCLEEIGD